MGFWNYDNVGIRFNKKSNDAELISRAMKCLGFTATDFLYMEETGVEGPSWRYDTDTTEQDYENSAGLSDSFALFKLLNFLFSDVDVYSVCAEGNNTSDSYTGTEEAYYILNGKVSYKSRRFDYCYGDGTAFGEEIRTDGNKHTDYSRLLRKAGNKRKHQNIQLKNISFTNREKELLDSLLNSASQFGYLELTQYVLNKMAGGYDIFLNNNSQNL